MVCITGVMDVKMDGSVPDKETCFKMLELFFLLKWIGAFILLLLLKLPSREFEPWFHLLYLYNSIMQPYIESCCHAMVFAPNCYLDMLVCCC